MEELAKVTHIENNVVSIESEVKSACSGCQQVDNCGSGQVSKAFPTKKLSLKLYSDLPLKIGDTVVLGLSDEYLLQSAWQVYMFPLIGLISFASLGQYLTSHSFFPHELLAVMLSAVGGYLGYLLSKSVQSSAKNRQKLTPKILRSL